MSIKITNNNPTEGKISIDIDNGHLEAINNIVKSYGIIDVEKALGFIIAVVSRGNGESIKIGHDEYLPGENIKQKVEIAPPIEENKSDD